MQLMTLPSSSLQEMPGRYLLLWTGLLAAFPQPLGYDPNWKQVAETDGPWSAFIWPSLDLLEWVHRRAMKIITGLEWYGDRVRELRLFSVHKRRLGDLTAPSVSKGGYKRAREGLLTRARSDRTRGNGFTLKEGRFRFKSMFTCKHPS